MTDIVWRLNSTRWHGSPFSKDASDAATEIARLRDVNQVLVHELAAAKRREDAWRIRADQAERKCAAIVASCGPVAAWHCFDKAFGTWHTIDSRELAESRIKYPEHWEVVALVRGPSLSSQHLSTTGE